MSIKKTSFPTISQIRAQLCQQRGFKYHTSTFTHFIDVDAGFLISVHTGEIIAENHTPSAHYELWAYARELQKKMAPKRVILPYRHW